MEKPLTPANYYQEKIQETVAEIKNTWRLEQIYKFIMNITKED